MSGNLWLDWAGLAVSLFNTILLIWLGLTVVMNTERRTSGLWVASGMILLGAVFFLTHTVILGYGLRFASQGINFWWHLGWFPVVLLPFAWYGVMLWYSGYWSDAQGSLRSRQQAGFIVTALLSAAIIAMLFYANPLPNLVQGSRLALHATFSIIGIPLLVLVYPFYILLCISLSINVLRHPGISERMMGDLARRRARPWLIAAALILLVVCLLVAWVMVWAVLIVTPNEYGGVPSVAELDLALARFDLVIAVFIAAAIVLLGQAIVSYEIFTGKTLPRGGLRRYWQRILILAVGYSLVTGWALTRGLPSIYSLLLASVLMVTFYALIGWRDYTEREHYIQRLRPFVTSQRLYEQLLAPSSGAQLGEEPMHPFQALCADVLSTQAAFLIPLGPLAPLAGAPLRYPLNDDVTPPSLATLLPLFVSPQTLCLPMQHDGGQRMSWVIPLWSERGLIGVLLLGDKQDGSLYTQEEIEIARTVGERLIDIQASAEMARRLMAMQRQRMAESLVLDQQTRRILHDEVLPELHAAMLTLSGEVAAREETITLLSDVHHQLADLLKGLPPVVAPQVARKGLVAGLRTAIDQEYAVVFDRVTWKISPEAETMAQALPPLAAEVLFYAAREVIRNAARHAQPAGEEQSLCLQISIHDEKGFELAIEDNGRGIHTPTEPTSGSGQGLALHSTLMAVIGGELVVESVPGESTRVTLRLP